jgi:predicted transcriptional regulator
MNEDAVYTVGEVASLMGFSRQTITRLFEHEPGVLIVKRPEKMHKRSHRSIRIPHAVYQRVVNRMTV